MIQQLRSSAARYRFLGLVSGLFCIIAGVWFWLGTGVIIGYHETQNDKNLEIGIWSSGMRIEQTFIASRNDLSRVDFALDSYHPSAVPYLECTLLEIETPEPLPRELTTEWILQHAKSVRHTRLNGWLLSGHMFNRFSFEPLADSEGKHYLLTILAPEVRKGGASILLASPEERYESGAFFVNGERQRGDLAFRALYRQSRVKIIQRVLAKLTLQKSFPFSSSVVYYVLFGAYIGGVLLFLLLLVWIAFERSGGE